MYRVELIKKGQAIKEVMPAVRTISVNSARIILVDDKERMYTYRPGDVELRNIVYKREYVNLAEDLIPIMDDEEVTDIDH